MCKYDNSITLLLCAFYASIQSNKKAIDITEMLCYYIITAKDMTKAKRSQREKTSKQAEQSESRR
jgi:hypothetical protein